MKILFIFAFILVCELAVCKEERTDFDEKTVDAADPKRYTCKSIVHDMNNVLLLSLNSTVIYRITQEKQIKLLGFSTQ